MKVIWKVDDGFAGNGEHIMNIPDEWFEGMEAEERKNEIDEIIFNEFKEIVSYDIIREEKD